jgi:hypothetical protein
MANDWTIGVEITDIVGVVEGSAANGSAMVAVVTKSGIWSGTDVSVFATLSFAPVAHGGSFSKVAYMGSGKFAAVTDNGKLYSLHFSTASSAPTATLMHTDAGANPITALAHAEADGSVGFACGNKVYTIPVGGGDATERMDSESVIEAGSKVYDLDYSSKGWVLLVSKADSTSASVIATANWSSTVTADFADDFSSSLPREVNYYENIAGGTWMIGREDGEVKQTTDLDTWRPPAGSPPLWVAIGGERVSYSTDSVSWTDYQISSAVTMQTANSLTFGKDGSGNDLWMCSTVPSGGNSINSLVKTSDPTDANSWTVVSDLGGDGTQNMRDVKYGNGVWATISNGGIDRSTDGGTTWQNTTGFGGWPYVGDLSLATDGAGNWVACGHSGNDFQIYKSLDDAQTWTLSTTISASPQSAQNYNKEVEYANGIWMVITPWGGTRCTSINLDNDGWVAIAGAALLNPTDFQYGGNDTWVAVTSQSGRNYTSTDNGATWTQNSGIAGVTTPMSIAYSNGVWLVSSNQFIHKSTDNGTTWTQAHSKYQYGYASIAYSSVLPNS